MLEVPWQAPRDPELQQYLRPTEFCEPDHPEIQQVTAKVIEGTKTPKEAAIKIYLFIRDEIKYGMTEPKSSIEVLHDKVGFCWTKSNLQVAMLRAAKILARYRVEPFHPLGGAYILPEEFWEFVWETEPIHGLAEVYLDDKWIGCDATVDKDLRPSALRIDWDGEHDLSVVSPWRKSISGTPPTYPVKLIEEMMKPMTQEILDLMNKHIQSIRAMPDGEKYRLHLEIHGKAITKYLEREAQRWKK
ncbi:MAG: transglutaminase family protein [Dehalococcoidia bacterium]|nr:transglutaminase family protein [Dehalococcoidia bacterium]